MSCLSHNLRLTARLSRNLHLALRTCCAFHETSAAPATQSKKPQVAKSLRTRVAKNAKNRPLRARSRRTTGGFRKSLGLSAVYPQALHLSRNLNACHLLSLPLSSSLLFFLFSFLLLFLLSSPCTLLLLFSTASLLFFSLLVSFRSRLLSDLLFPRPGAHPQQQILPALRSFFCAAPRRERPSHLQPAEGSPSIFSTRATPQRGR